MIKDYSYEYEYDSFYCYPGSNVLKNKLYIKDTALLAEAERKITGLRTIEAQQKRICGRFDFKHLKQIHKFLFGDIYEWAGKIRSVNISKGNQFCRVEFIEEQMTEIFDKLKKENYLKDLRSQKEVAKRLAYYLGEINAIHPFREGNGRTQRMFIENLADSLDWNLDFMNIGSEDMLLASVKAFDLDYTLLENLLDGAMEKKKQK